VVGLPAAGQSDLDMKHLVGHCVNLLALRTDGRRHALRHLFESAPHRVAGRLRPPAIHLRHAAAQVESAREPGRIPLVPVVFNIDMNMDDGVAFDGLSHRFVSNPRKYENFELFLNATGSTEQLTLEWSYNTDLFDAATVRGWMDPVQRRWHSASSTGRTRHHCLLGMADAMGPVPPRRPPTRPGMDNAPNYPRESGMGTVRWNGDAGGPRTHRLELGEQRMSYGELHRRVLVMAAALERAGVQPRPSGGLCTDRSPDMVAAMLAILWRGAAFVPFDPGLSQGTIALHAQGHRCADRGASQKPYLPTCCRSRASQPGLGEISRSR
jgi:non-ribosomal peptide synthetase component F